MPKANLQKIKLLQLMELLRLETDEAHPMSTNEVCNRLNALNISCDRRTLGQDITCLNSQGFEVMTTRVGHAKAYYVEDRGFSVPELKILIDAVQAAGFITEKKSAELIDKIACLGGIRCSEILKGNMVCFNTRKHSNEAIYYTVSYLEEALRQKKKASFYYFDLDENGDKVYRKEKKRYIVDPIALIYNEDNYYLMCYSPKYEDICNYRVDRMEAVTVEKDAVNDGALLDSSDIAQYTEQVFKMYGGQEEEIELQFDDSLIGSVYDKFGEKTQITRINNNNCRATVKVQISPTFWGWMLQFEGKMNILSPKSSVKEYKRYNL